MKDWKSHLIFGLLLTIVWFSVIYFSNALTLTLQSAFLLVLATMFATLFPDIDLSKSKIRNFISITVSAIVSLLYILLYPDTWYFAPAYFLVLYVLLRNVKTKHRGVTHTIPFALVFSFLLVLLAHFVLFFSVHEFLFWFVIVFFSYALHLLLDRI
jgi:membrane-bound metal-dependent hydrolase YbcI (DUF457 family)